MCKFQIISNLSLSCGYKHNKQSYHIKRLNKQIAENKKDIERRYE